MGCPARWPAWGRRGRGTCLNEIAGQGPVCHSADACWPSVAAHDAQAADATTPVSTPAATLSDVPLLSPAVTAAPVTDRPEATKPSPSTVTSPPRQLPPGGSQLAVADNTCATCHGEADLWEADTLRLFIAHEGLANDVHWQKGVNCHDCHGGDPTSFDVPIAHSVEVEAGSNVVPFRSPLDTVWQSCGGCHQGADG